MKEPKNVFKSKGDDNPLRLVGSSVVDKILKCDHSNDSYRSSGTFPRRCLLCCTEVVLTFESVDVLLSNTFL